MLHRAEEIEEGVTQSYGSVIYNYGLAFNRCLFTKRDN